MHLSSIIYMVIYLSDAGSCAQYEEIHSVSISVYHSIHVDVPRTVLASVSELNHTGIGQARIKTLPQRRRLPELSVKSESRVKYNRQQSLRGPLIESDN